MCLSGKHDKLLFRCSVSAVLQNIQCLVHWFCFTFFLALFCNYSECSNSISPFLLVCILYIAQCFTVDLGICMLGIALWFTIVSIYNFILHCVLPCFSVYISGIAQSLDCIACTWTIKNNTIDDDCLGAPHKKPVITCPVSTSTGERYMCQVHY